eukprot:g2299.t1
MEEVLLAATDLEEATMSAIHFLAAQDSAEAQLPGRAGALEGRAGRKNDEKIQTRRAAQDDMRPLLEGSILFKVIDDSLQRVVCRTSSSPLEDSVRRLLARNKSAEAVEGSESAEFLAWDSLMSKLDKEIGPRDPFLDRQLLQFAPSVCFNMTEEDPGGLVTLRKPLPALDRGDVSLDLCRDLLPEPDGRHGASDATASTACAKSSQEESRRRSRRRHSGDAKQSNPTLAKPNASNASSRRAEPLRLRPRERPKAGTANAASRARNARSTAYVQVWGSPTSRETAAKTSSAPRLRIRSRSREELRRRHSRHSTEDVLRRGEPPRTSTRISLMARDTRSRAHASHASSRASARDSTGRGPARDAPDEPSTRAEGRHSARHSTRRTRETEDRPLGPRSPLQSSWPKIRRPSGDGPGARLAGAAASLPATMTPPEYLEQVQESAGEGRRDEGRSGHRERRREDPGREATVDMAMLRAGRPSNPSKSDRSRHEERRRSRSRRRESSKELNGRINGHDTSARGPPAPLPADVMGGVWQETDVDLYRKWIKKQLVNGHALVWMIMLDGAHYPVYPGLPYGLYSHVEPVVGILSDHPLTDENFYDDDVVLHYTDADTHTYYRTMASLPGSYRNFSHCPGHDYESRPLALSIDPWQSEPDVRRGDQPSQLTGTLTASGLTTGHQYVLLRWDGVLDAFQDEKATVVYRFTASKDTEQYTDPRTFSSDSSAQALGTALDTAACAGCGAGSGAAAEHEELLGRCPRAVLAADLTEPSKEKRPRADGACIEMSQREQELT